MGEKAPKSAWTNLLTNLWADERETKINPNTLTLADCEIDELEKEQPESTQGTRTSFANDGICKLVKEQPKSTQSIYLQTDQRPALVNPEYCKWL